MGLRQCCCARKPENNNDLYEEKRTETTREKMKPQFQFTSMEKIVSCDFGELSKTKRFKIKQKKRLMLRSEDKHIHILSFYLGTFVFLLNSIEIEDTFTIVNSGFLNKSNSKRYCLILENNEKKCEILIITIQKLLNLNPVLLDVKPNSHEDVMAKKSPSASDSDVSRSNYCTQNSEIGPNIKEQENCNGQSYRIKDDNKKIMESILNSSISSCNEEFDMLPSDDKKHAETVVIQRHSSETQTANSYFKTLNKKVARRKFEDVYLAKYNYYMNNIQQIIDDNNFSIQNSKIENDMVYVYSDYNRVMKAYSISKSGRKYKNILCYDLFQHNPFSDMRFFHNGNGSSMLLINGTNVSNYKNGVMTFTKNIKDLLMQGEKENTELNIVKITNAYKNPTFLRLNPGLMHLIISGLCNLNTNVTESHDSSQFLSYLSIDKLDTDNFKEVSIKPKLKILKDVPSIIEISYGPYSNGPVLTGHINGTILLWNTYTLCIMKTMRIFAEDFAIIKILNEPTGVTICCSEHRIKSLNMIEKKFEYYFNENEENELERIVVKTSK